MKKLQKRLQSLRNQKGFTLVELIVVIVIIGILAAILIPRMTGFTNKAQATEGNAIAKQIATAYDAYRAEKGAWPTADSDADAIAYVEKLALLGLTKGSTAGTYTLGSSSTAADNATLKVTLEKLGGIEVVYTKGATTTTFARDAATDESTSVGRLVEKVTKTP